jgi:polyphenol oxidase
MQIHETNLGFEIDTPEYLFFFGKKDSSLEALRAAYSNYEFLRVKQVHGNTIERQVTGINEIREADGHWTKMERKALLISTADCVPVLVVHPASGSIMGMHAGWRGVASRIVPKGLTLLQDQGAKGEELFTFIGPHIQQPSFEVGSDVKDQLMSSAGFNENSDENGISIPSKNPDKYKMDLNAIVKLQISEFSLSPDQVFDLHLDTFTDDRFHSFRRDKEKAGRQFSFVVKK